jgi:lipoprotein signal peptidase
VADSAISVGAALVVLESLLDAWRSRQAARDAGSPGQGA